MNRTVLGAFAALLLVAGGLFWWQGRAAVDVGAAPPSLAGLSASAQLLPDETGAGLSGAVPPEADEATREQQRFNRMDRNRDSIVTRVEMLTPRVAAFRKLDADGNNLLSFEEWAVKTSNRYKAADRNRDGKLDRAEFVSTKPKVTAKPPCRCAPVAKRPAGKQGPVRPNVIAPPEVVDEDAEE